MRFITGSIDIRLSLEEVNTINDLIKRDTAKAVVDDDKYNICYCPSCNHVPLKGDLFCSRCGQRLDMENKAL